MLQEYFNTLLAIHGSLSHFPKSMGPKSSKAFILLGVGYRAGATGELL